MIIDTNETFSTNFKKLVRSNMCVRAIKFFQNNEKVGTVLAYILVTNGRRPKKEKIMDVKNEKKKDAIYIIACEHTKSDLDHNYFEAHRIVQYNNLWSKVNELLNEWQLQWECFNGKEAINE